MGCVHHPCQNPACRCMYVCFCGAELHTGLAKTNGCTDLLQLLFIHLRGASCKIAFSPRQYVFGRCRQVVSSMPAPVFSAENSPTAAAAMAKAPSVLAARSRPLPDGDAVKQTSPLVSAGPPPGAAARAGSGPLENLIDVGEVW